MANVLNPAQVSRELTTPPGRLTSGRKNPLLAPGTVGPAIKQAFVMLRPDIQWKNPVMFVVEIGAFLTLFYLVQAALGKSESQLSPGYFVAVDIWSCSDQCHRRDLCSRAPPEVGRAAPDLAISSAVE